jgi:hypothetical protein
MRHSFGTIITLIACILMLGAVWGAYGWLALQTVGLKASVAQMISDRDADKQKVAYSETLRSLLRDTADQRTALTNASVLSAVDVVDRIRAVGSDAGADIAIDTIGPAFLDARIAKNAPALTVSVSANGSFAHLYRFVQLLETAPLPIMVDQASFDHQAVDKTLWTLRVRISIYTENAK